MGSRKLERSLGGDFTWRTESAATSMTVEEGGKEFAFIEDE